MYRAGQLKLSLGKPLLEMRWFYMGIAQIALDPPSLKRANVEKKVSQTILASLYTPLTVHMETRHFKKGLP